MSLHSLDDSYPSSRDELRRVAVHVLARAQHAASGRIGLRATPGGFGTSLYGADRERLRVSGGLLVHEIGVGTPTVTRSMDLCGSTLGEVARFVGADLAADFSVGDDTPPVGDADAPLRLDGSAMQLIGNWYAVVAQALDRVVSTASPSSSPTLAQLWPEHFDLALDLAHDASNPNERRVNLGGSAGDGFHQWPYLYVGPWTPERSGDPEFWNAPFGAVIGFGEVVASPDPVDVAVAFFCDGLEMLSA